MDFAFLTETNIAACTSLFDLIVLVWAEIKSHDGIVHDAMMQLTEDEDAALAAAEAGLRQVIVGGWAVGSRAATKEVDAAARAAISGLLRQHDTAAALPRILLGLARMAADVMVRSSARPLNQSFQDVGLLYLQPSATFRQNMPSSPGPPKPVGKSALSQIPGFSIVDSRHSVSATRFIDPGPCRTRRGNGPLVVAIADFCDHSDALAMTKTHTAGGTTYYYVHLVPGPDCAERLRSTLCEANNAGAHVCVLPELTMTPALLELARETVAQIHESSCGTNTLRIVVAGTLHEREGRRRVHNVSHVLLENGEVLWRQEKLTPFGWSIGGEPAAEPLDTRSRTLCVCDLWLGRTVVSVCLDYLKDDLSELAESLKVDCFLVPAMSATTSLFGRRAYDNTRELRAATFLSNTVCQPERPDPIKAASLAATPKRGSEARVVLKYTLSPQPSVHCTEVV